MKKVGLVLLVLILIAGGFIYHNRFKIVKLSAESIIRENLPPYVKIKELTLDPEAGTLKAKGLTVEGPKGFESKFLAGIEELSCKYRLKENNILNGIEITRIAAVMPIINIERRADGHINVNEMSTVMARKKISATGAIGGGLAAAVKGIAGRSDKKKSISDFISLPDVIEIRNGAVVFRDGLVSQRPYKLTFERLAGTLTIKLSENFEKVTWVASRGEGFVNGDVSQRIGWEISLDPAAETLTMSNTYKADNVDITLFKPYYDKYSPIVVTNGRFSGSLIFNFDNNNIGSMNTLVIRGLRFAMKEGDSGMLSMRGWTELILPDVITYLQSSPDEVIFDFKIKGPMDNPRFYLGPQVKKAIQFAVVDKVSQVLESMSNPEGAAQAGTKAVQSDTEKVVSLIKGLLDR
ncbi:MAG: DUF748 domain-containing protein [Candidatus Omnitrophota bacterium]